MFTTLVCTRKYNKEKYKFFLNEPEYVGEKGCCGIELKPYVHVETPENGFGYADTILLYDGQAYTLHRYLQPWILKQIEKKMKEIISSYPYIRKEL